MVVRGPKPTLPSPVLRAEGPAACTTHCREPLGSQLPPCSPLPARCDRYGRSLLGRGWHHRALPLRAVCMRGVHVCVCVRGGWAGAGGRKGSPGCGGGGGFSTFLYLCNQREEKFLWLFLRMVCSQDLEHLFHQQPFASFSGDTRDRDPGGLERQCQAALMALPAPLRPIAVAGQLALLPLALPPLQLHTCLNAVLLPSVPQPPAAVLAPQPGPPLPSCGTPLGAAPHL